MGKKVTRMRKEFIPQNLLQLLHFSIPVWSLCFLEALFSRDFLYKLTSRNDNKENSCQKMWLVCIFIYHFSTPWETTVRLTWFCEISVWKNICFLITITHIFQRNNWHNMAKSFYSVADNRREWLYCLEEYQVIQWPINCLCSSIHEHTK